MGAAASTYAAPVSYGTVSYGTAAPTVGSISAPTTTYAAPAAYAAPIVETIAAAAPVTYAAPVSYAAAAPVVEYVQPVTAPVVEYVQPVTQTASYVAPATTQVVAPVQAASFVQASPTSTQMTAKTVAKPQYYQPPPVTTGYQTVAVGRKWVETSPSYYKTVEKTDTATAETMAVVPKN